MRWSVSCTLAGMLGACSSPLAPPEEFLPTVTFDDIVAKPDGISVNWYFQAAMVLRPENDFITPRIFDHFRVEREEVPSGGWKVIAKNLPAITRTYLDRDVEPGAEYRYRIVSYLADGRPSAVETPYVASGPPRWNFLFERAEESKGSSPGSVDVVISKFEKGIGQVSISHIQHAGEPLGGWAESPGESASFRHQVVFVDGRTLEVDFDCGASLIGVTPITAVVESSRCKVIVDLSGMWIGCQRIVKKTPMTNHRVTYRDSGGVHEIIVAKPGLENQLCFRHRLDPNEAPRDKRLFNARILLDEADRLWNSDSTASIQTYQRLLKEYGDLVIELQARNRVQRRAAQGED